MLEKRRHAQANLGALRRALMWEPRGHADMYGAIVTDPVSPEADLGVLFLHNEGFSTMCGHGIIALATVLLETGLIPRTGAETRLGIDTPAGLVTAYGGPQGVRFHNVPSFVLGLDEVIRVPEVGEVRYDLAFGGAFYAFVQARDVELRCTPDDHDRLIETGMRIKRAIMEARPIVHPEDHDLGFLYGTIFIGEPEEGADSRNVCIFAEGEVDRSPTGTGVSARMAIHHARGEIGIGEPMVIESILGTRFTGRVAETTRLGIHDAVIPEVEGSAHLTGRHEFLLSPDDPLRHGFILR